MRERLSEQDSIRWPLGQSRRAELVEVRSRQRRQRAWAEGQQPGKHEATASLTAFLPRDGQRRLVESMNLEDFEKEMVRFGGGRKKQDTASRLIEHRTTVKNSRIGSKAPPALKTIIETLIEKIAHVHTPHV